MGEFTELSIELLVALTDPQIERYIDLQCAEDGVEMWVGNPPLPPKHQAPSEVAGYRIAGLILGSREEAQMVANTLSACSRFNLTYASGRWSGPQYLKPDDSDLSITPVAEMTEAEFSIRQSEMQRLDAAQSEYDKLRRKFDQTVEARRAVNESIRARITSAREEIYRTERMRTLYAHYLELSNNSIEVARRFLLKAHPDAEAQAPDLFNDAVPPPPARALRLREEQPA